MEEDIKSMTKDIIYIVDLIKAVENYDNGNLYDLERSIETTTEIIFKLHNLRAKAVHIRNFQNNKINNIIYGK